MRGQSWNVGELRAPDNEHEKLAQLTRRFSDAMVQVLQDQEVPRDWFGQTAREFIGRYRQHISWEEEFFPCARDSLTADQWTDVAARFSAVSDLLFDFSDEERYRALRQELLSLDDDGN